MGRLERPQAVHYVRTTSHPKTITQFDEFEYRPELGWRWLQRVAIAVLAWIGAFRQETITAWKRTTRENDELVKSLLGQELEFLDRLYRGEDMRIYIGPDEEPQLLRLMEALSMRPISFVGRIKIGHGYDLTWRDIPVTVVPWMKGAVIVPVR